MNARERVDRYRDFETVEPGEQGLEHDPGFEAGEICAEAVAQQAASAAVARIFFMVLGTSCRGELAPDSSENSGATGQEDGHPEEDDPAPA